MTLNGKLKNNYSQLLSHRTWGIAIFLLLMFIMFQAVFFLGAFPMEWISMGVAWLGDTLRDSMSDGPLKSLLIDGIVNGVGGLVVFVPNVALLYLFISLMEMSGYMGRVVYLLDGMMHRIGLHGECFVSLVMAFGCNVPAVISTRDIESRSSRLITMLIIPLMSCSARLPVYLIMAGAFFPGYAGTVLFLLYILGVMAALVVAALLNRYVVKNDEQPYVLDIPPMRMPTLKASFKEAWHKTEHYLSNIVGIIMVASVLMWALSYYPRAENPEDVAQQTQQSYVGKIGEVVHPLLAPLGFNWQTSVALVSGIAGKEIIVSSLMVLYHGDESGDTAQLVEKMKEPSADGKAPFTPLVAFVFLIFVLFYFPCVPTLLSIMKESGHWRWGAFALLYTTALAWGLGFVIYQIGILLI